MRARGFVFAPLLLLAGLALLCGAIYYYFATHTSPATPLAPLNRGVLTPVGNGLTRYTHPDYGFSIDFPPGIGGEVAVVRAPTKTTRVLVTDTKLYPVGEQATEPTTLQVRVGEAAPLADGTVGYGVSIVGGTNVAVGTTEWQRESGVWVKPYENGSEADYVAMLAPIHGTYRLYLFFAPVKPRDVQHYADLLRQIAETVTYLK